MIYKDFSHYESRGVSRHLYDYSRQSNLPVAIDSYAEAKRWYDARKGEWLRSEPNRPVGKDTDRSRVMRMLTDKSIEFDYNGETLATWHPDDTVTVEPFPDSRYGAFERHVLPVNIRTEYRERMGKLIMLARLDSMDIWITLADGRRVANPETLVVNGKGGVRLKRSSDVDRWEPVDPDDLTPFQWFEIDKSQVSYVSRKYNIGEFVTAIETALQMGAEIKTNGASNRAYNSAIDHKVIDPETGEPLSILQLLEAGRYIDAASLVRISQTTRYDAVNKRYIYETGGLKTSDVKAIRRLAYKELGCIYLEQQEIISLAQLSNVDTKMREFGKPVTDRVL